MAGCYKGRCLGLVPLLCLSFLLMFFVVLPPILYRNRFSPYYIGEPSTREERLEAYRLENTRNKEAAEDDLHRLSYNINKLARIRRRKLSLETPSRYHPPTVSIAVVIITLDRARMFNQKYQPGYVTQVLSKFVDIVNSSYIPPHFVLNFSLCNIDKQPLRYEEAMKISKYVTMVHRGLNESGQSVHQLEQEKRDYVFCLEKGVQSNSDYVLLVEDDTIPVRSVFTSIDHLVRIRIPNKADIAYVKLYHPERLIGYWNPELSRWVELLSLGFTLAGLSYSMLNHRLWKGSFPVIIGIFAFYFCAFLFMIGRGNLIWLRDTSDFFRLLGPAPQCCSPAFLFPSKSASTIADYLKSVTCGKGYAKDSAIDTFLSQSSLRGLYYEPNLFSHIGVYSSLHMRLVDPVVVS